MHLVGFYYKKDDVCLGLEKFTYLGVRARIILRWILWKECVGFTYYSFGSTYVPVAESC